MARGAPVAGGADPAASAEALHASVPAGDTASPGAEDHNVADTAAARERRDDANG